MADREQGRLTQAPLVDWQVLRGVGGSVTAKLRADGLKALGRLPIDASGRWKPIGPAPRTAMRGGRWVRVKIVSFVR